MNKTFSVRTVWHCSDLKYNHSAKCDNDHIHRVQENRNVRVFAINGHSAGRPSTDHYTDSHFSCIFILSQNVVKAINVQMIMLVWTEIVSIRSTSEEYIEVNKSITIMHEVIRVLYRNNAHFEKSDLHLKPCRNLTL